MKHFSPSSVPGGGGISIAPGLHLYIGGFSTGGVVGPAGILSLAHIAVGGGFVTGFSAPEEERNTKITSSVGKKKGPSITTGFGYLLENEKLDL